MTIMANSLLPCLVFEYGDERQTKLYGASDGAYRPCEIGPLLSNQNSWVTAQGWVLARVPETSVTFLWDPQDPEDGRVALPPMAQAPHAGSSCVLSGDPNSPDGCTVVVAEPYGNTVLWYCHTGSSAPEWVKYEYDLGGSWAVIGKYREWNKKHISRLAPYHGKFYYPIGRDKCGVLEFSPEPVLSTVNTKGVRLTFPPSGEKCVHASSFLLDLDGELHMVWIFYADLGTKAVADVAVYKMGFERSRWVRVDSIGDRAIVAASTCGFAGWCPADKFGLAPNSVYWVNRTGTGLHIYDIGTNMEEVLQFEGVAELSRLPFWLVPVHQRP